MEFNWGAEKQGNEASTSLGDNGRENLMLELDDKTLQCLVGSGAAGLLGSHDGPAFPSTSAGPSGSGREKRKHDDSAAYNWMAMGGFGEEEEEEADDSDDSQRRIGRKGRPMSTAAVAKATREKARRERLNECFEELARLCDPTGRGVKTDRVSVIADAIRVLTQLRVENNQLRQLNKFLEERVSNLERARAQNVYQQHAGAGMHTGVLAAGPGRIVPLDLNGGGGAEAAATTAADSQYLRPASAHGGAVPVPGQALGHAFLHDPFAGGALPEVDYGALYGAALGGAGPAPPPVPASMLAPAPLKAEALGGLTGVELTARLEDDAGAGLAWLPAPNASEDSKLRPPAA
ncbi:hypothetical protein ACKKBG_A29565 [Auxenochlorella protothecoides x Auxenochlorella symbiontica]